MWKKWHFVIVFLALFFYTAMAFASYPMNKYPNVPPIKHMQHNGVYSIFLLNQGKWQEAGELTYDEFFRERAVDLSRHISGFEPIRVRIVQKGGEAAHIDSVFLGDKSPVEVFGVTKGITKLSKQDFDVIDAYGKNIEVIFDKNIQNKMLKLTARVEGINRGFPFQFPPKNLCQKIDTNAQFYTYRLNSKKGGMKLDGQLDEVSHKLPFFQEYSLSGTGHPSAYTYGWVWNDDKYLYVAIDFTGDNTMDGNKDFAKVYINTESGVKEFKISVPETKWGKPGFTYTDKVDYQHKVYEFKIPLNEITKVSSVEKDTLLLAFSTYGTDGACCFPDYSCNNTWNTEEDCFADGGDLFLPLTECDPDPCRVDRVCCTPEATCFLAWNEGDCQEGNPSNIFLAGEISCNPNPCQQQAEIPTMTQWGIIIFVVLAGLGAAYYMRRHTRKNS